MKKIIVGLILTGLLVLPAIGLAQPKVATTSDEVFLTINSVITYAFWILLFAAAVVIVVAAYTFLTAAGDPDKTSKARNYVLYALIAIVVGFLAKAVIALVARMLNVTIPLW